MLAEVSETAMLKRSKAKEKLISTPSGTEAKETPVSSPVGAPPDTADTQPMVTDSQFSQQDPMRSPLPVSPSVPTLELANSEGLGESGEQPEEENPTDDEIVEPVVSHETCQYEEITPTCGEPVTEDVEKLPKVKDTQHAEPTEALSEAPQSVAEGNALPDFPDDTMQVDSEEEDKDKGSTKAATKGTQKDPGVYTWNHTSWLQNAGNLNFKKTFSIQLFIHMIAWT